MAAPRDAAACLHTGIFAFLVAITSPHSASTPHLYRTQRASPHTTRLARTGHRIICKLTLTVCKVTL
jgi:hypothetical protein